MDFRTFDITVDEPAGVADVLLRGTGDGNAMGGLVWSELPEVVRRLDADDRVAAVVLHGAGDCFSVGLDLRWYLPHYRRLTRRDDLRTRLLAEASAMQDAITAVARSRSPWIAAIHGACVGAGLDLAAACDIRLAAADAYASLREIRIGIVSDLGGLQRLPRVIGAAATRELALTGRDVPAEEAHRLGLVTRVHPDPATTLADARAVARQIATSPRPVVAGVKALLEQDFSDGLRQAALWNTAFLPPVDLLTAALRGDPPT